MSNISRDNQIRTLAKMQCTYDTMRTCFPADKGIMTEWHRLTKETQKLIDMQNESIKTLDKTEE